MNITKMSLVAALLVSSSAFAIENFKVSGDAKLFYSTSDANRTVSNGKDDGKLFSTADSAAQAAISLSLSADLTKSVSFGTKVTALTSLGLEGQLVDSVWEGTNGTSDSYIVNDLWLATTMGKTTAKAGRMELDTPLVFSEQWSITANTFEAAVLINQDIPSTTLVGAYVGGHNGSKNINTAGTPVTNGSGFGAVIANTNKETTFSQFYNGAYTVGAINNSWEPLTAQLWYYDVTHVAQATWLQADLNMGGILVGAQYSTIHSDATDIEGNVYALMAGYEMKDTFTAKVSFSQTGEDAGAGANLSGTGQSKVYTETWWNYGKVNQADTTSFNVTLEAPIKDVVDLGLYYTNADRTLAAGNTTDDGDLSELTLSASKSFGALDTALVYTNSTVGNSATEDASAYNQIQVYLTYNY